MDIRALLKQGSSLEELEQSLLDLDSEFDFKCRHCGKCCKNQDTVLFTARDIYNIAKKLGKTTEHVIQECGEVSIGYSSRIPLVHMVPIGRNVVVHCYGMMDAAVSMTASLQPAHCFL